MTAILSGGDPTSNQPAEVLSTLVGEGKKFKDVESLARGKVESDNFITKLQEENQRMREELEKNMNLERQLAALSSGEPAPNAGGNPAPVAAGNQPGAVPIKPEDVEALLEQKLNMREADKAKQANLRQVDEFLLKHFGDVNKAKDAINSLNASLGINISELAAVSPAAVTKLIAGSSQGAGVVTEHSTVRPVGLGGEVRNKAYYDKLRSEMGNSRFYTDRKLQLQIHKDAQSLGDAFYN